MTRVLVVVPTYNERDNVATLITRLFEACPSCDLLVIDDSSPDGTGGVVEEIAEDYEGHIAMLERPRKAGLGTAYVEGFRWGVAHSYDAIVAMDADLSHDPAIVPELLRTLDRADLAIGSRYVSGGGISNWGFLRRGLSRMGNLYARLWLRFGVRDSTSGFRAYRSGALRAMDLASFKSEGYAFQIETAWRIHQDGGRIAEVPITFVERQHGASKLSRRIVFEALLWVPVWAFRAGRK